MIVTWLVLCCLVGLGPFELSADATALPSRLKVGIAPSPYDSLVNHLWAGNKKTSKQFRRLGCSKTDILAAVKELAQSHAGLRSVDRLTETFKSSKRSRAFLTTRIAAHRQHRRGDMKEAAKLSEYITVVERSLQAAELIAAAASAVTHDRTAVRSARMALAGVKEIYHTKNITWGSVTIGMSIMFPLNDKSNNGRFKVKEAIVALYDCNNDNAGGSSLIDFLDRFPRHVSSPGMFVEEEIAVHPGVLDMAKTVLGHLFYCVSKQSTDKHISLNNGVTKGGGNYTVDNIRFVGHSVGGAVAAVSSMLLEGSLSAPGLDAVVSSSNNGSSVNVTESKQLCDMVLAAYRRKNKVRCFTIGSPPCVSRGVVPSYVTSLVFGDDFVTRTTKASILQLANELKTRLRSGNGKYLRHERKNSLRDSRGRMRETPKIGSIGKKKKGLFGATSGLRSIAKPLVSIKNTVSEVVSLGARGLKTYASGTTNDLENLNVPGRVFYLKNKDVHKILAGMSSNVLSSEKKISPTLLQRVLRGSWREDILWRIHDLMVSDNIMKDHSLEAYVAALAMT